MPDFELVGSSVGQLKLFDRHAVNLLAVSRKGRRITHRLRGVKLRAGDVVVFRGNLAAMPETLGELHCLPLAERDLRIGRKASLVPIACSRRRDGACRLQRRPGGNRLFRCGCGASARAVVILARGL